MKPRTVGDCQYVSLPVIRSPQGKITPVHGGVEVPFEIARTFYVYDIPGGETRGSHAHLTCEEFIVCLLGSFDVIVDDGVDRDVFHLDRSYRGLYLPPMIWISYSNLAPGSICLVLASRPYEETDYIRDYDTFVERSRQ